MTDIPPPFDELWFRLLIGFLIGGALGSFVTMLSYRLPRKLSIIAPPSHCPHCKHHLTARDLVPIASYLLMRGKCRYCGAEAGSRYVWIEVLTAMLSAAAFVAAGFRPAVLPLLAIIVTIITVMTIRIERDN